MRCCASPTISSVDRIARAGIAFETLLLEPMLQPLMPAFGDFGGFALDLVARDIAAHDGNGFVRLIDAALDRRSE